MSQYAVTIGFPHDAKKPLVVLTGPEVPLATQRQALKEISDKLHPEYRQVEIMSSGHGLLKRRKFLPPAKPESKSAAKAK